MTVMLNDYEYLVKTMHDHRQDFLTELSKIVHPKYLAEFAGIFSYALIEEDASAEMLADRLKLNQLHVLAYLDRETEFEDVLFQHMAESHF
jgi:hypothetical protein